MLLYKQHIVQCQEIYTVIWPNGLQYLQIRFFHNHWPTWEKSETATKIKLHIWNLSFSHKDRRLGFEAFSPFARKDTVRGKSMSFQMWIHLCRVINSEWKHIAWKNRLWTALVICTMLDGALWWCPQKLSRAVIVIKWETSPIRGRMKIIIIATKLVVKRMTPTNGFFDQRT